MVEADAGDRGRERRVDDVGRVESAAEPDFNDRHLDVLSPPLTITKEQVDFVVDTLKRAILKATAELKAEGVI